MQQPLTGTPSSLCKLSWCLHRGGLEISQKPGPCPSPGLVQGTRHFSASVQAIRGSWPFFHTKAQLHAPSPPASTAHGFKKLPDSCLWGLLGQPWIPHQFPHSWERQPGVTLQHCSGAQAYPRLFRHVVMGLPSPWQEGWQWVSPRLLGAASEGTDPPSQPDGAPQLGAP